MNSFLKAILFVGVLLFGLVMVLSNLLGDKCIDTLYHYRIKNNTSDTLYIEKPYSEDSLYAEIIKIDNKLFVKIEPHSDSNFHSERSTSINHKNKPFQQWANINDTLSGYFNKNADTFKFIFGLKDKCQIDEEDNLIVCTRIIDKPIN